MMKEKLTVLGHEILAFNQWFAHVESCANELGIDLTSDEIESMQDSFDECRQLKILYETGEIKVKWEHKCWWADCPKAVFHGDYYCVLSKPTWYHPGGEEE